MRLVLVGGFLGAGKTTAIIRLAREAMARGSRVGIVSNDQADDLVDTRLFQESGLNATQVAGGCFCCRFDDLMARADAFRREQVDLLIAEPVGSCVDVTATVINPIVTLYGDAFTVSPYTVLVDPIRALQVLGREAPVGFSERVTYIYRMQQLESDAVAISKIDLLTPDVRSRVRRLVEEQLPGRHIAELSARTGEGFSEWTAALWATPGGTRPTGEVDYAVYASGEAELGWLNGRVELEGDIAFDVDAAIMQLAGTLQAAMKARSLPIAHVKLLLDAGTGLAVASTVDLESAPVLSRASACRASTARLLINLRVQSGPGPIDQVVRPSVEEWAERLGARVVGGSGACFAPPAPVPVHRIRG